MRITRIQIHQPVGLLRLITDTGHEGLCPGVTPEIAQPLLDHYAPIVLGVDPMTRERLWYALLDVDRSRGVALRACLDIALWDLAAKAVHLPLYRFINGFRDRVAACLRSAGTLGPDVAVQQAVRAKEDGFAGYILSADFSVDTTIAALREIRYNVGDDFYLIYDGNQRGTVAEAIRVGRTLDEIDAFRFDRPRPDGDLTGSRTIADAIDTPVSVGIRSVPDASQVYAAQAAEHLTAGVPWSGGITDALKIIRCAEAFGELAHLHGSGGAEGFAHIHILGAVKNTPFFEAMNSGVQHPSTIIRNPITVQNGLVVLPSAPGLGINLDYDALERATQTVMRVS